MDKVIYTAANAATRTTEHQAALSNNMANINTPGFKAQLAAYRSVPINGPGQQTRVLTTTIAPITKAEQGPLIQTGKATDLAIDGQGWFAVQAPDGQESYTRAGGMLVNDQGLLSTTTGHLVLSDAGQPIAVPELAQISFNKEGGINAIGAGDRPRDIQNIAQLKLVNPDINSMRRSEDGLFRVVNAEGNAQIAPMDEAVRISSEVVEGSNVSPAQEMVGLIENARRFEMQMKIITDANQNAQKANSILSFG